MLVFSAFVCSADNNKHTTDPTFYIAYLQKDDMMRSAPARTAIWADALAAALRPPQPLISARAMAGMCISCASGVS